MTGKSKRYLRYALLCVASVLATVAPLATVLILNRERYFTEPGQSVKLTVGGVICVILLLLAVLGKLKMPRRVVAVATALLLSWLFGVILEDITLLLAMWLLGEVIDLFIFAPLVRRAREGITIDRAATATAQAVSEALKGSGRV